MRARRTKSDDCEQLVRHVWDGPGEAETPILQTAPFAEKASRNIVPVDLLWEKNIVSTGKKQAEKDGL